MKKNTESNGPGRPRYQMKYPTTKQWTFQDLMEANDVSLRTGKGPNCTKLTLTKNMDRDLFIREEGKNGKRGKILRTNPKSVVVRLTDVFAEPSSKDGLGRKGYLYCLRAKFDGRTTRTTKPAKAVRATRKTRTPRATAAVSQTPVADALDKIHAALAAPTPVVNVTPAAVPVVTVTPAPAPTPAPTPAPVVATVAATPAPASETSTSPVTQESANAETPTPVVNS